MNFPLRLAIIWFVFLSILFIFTASLAQSLFLLFPLIFWAVLLAGGLVSILAMASIRRDSRRAGIALAICFAGFSLYFSNLGFVGGRFVLFQIRKPSYVRQLAETERLGRVPDRYGCTDDGPPVRHGFYWQRGILDNWSVVVFDPSGKIAEINDAKKDMEKINAHELSDLFGGTFVSCQNVGGGWYICWFT